MLSFILLPLLLLLPSLSQSANVLVLSGAHGSRRLITINVATKLAEFGHNVTLFSLMDDVRQEVDDRKFTLQSVEDVDGRAQNLRENVEEMLEGILDLPSAEMVNNMVIGTEKAWQNVENYTEFAAAIYEGEQFAKLLEDVQFDLIAVEESATIPAMKVLGTLKTPIIGLMPIAATKSVRDMFALPGLINSEPSMLNEVTGDNPPSLFERIGCLVRMFKLYAAYIPFLLNHFKDEMSGSQDFLEYMAVYDVVFMLDHPAYSFPSLAPPNTFYLGAFHLQDRPVLPLPDIYTNFLENCPNKHVVYMSFGSYLKDLTKFQKSESMIRAIKNMDVCVVMKSETDIAREFDLPKNRVLTQSWIPQKDLLGSGKVDLFISHCGNNGRLESLYYNVPLLCVPLFMDQLHNARLIRRNGFGGYILKEDLTEDTFRTTAEESLENLPVHKEKIRKATDIVVNDPGAGISALNFYSDLLIREAGHAEFLINKMIMKQSSFEIYNLDIILVAFLGITFLVVWLMICACRILKFSYRKICGLGKFKTE